MFGDQFHDHIRMMAAEAWQRGGEDMVRHEGDCRKTNRALKHLPRGTCNLRYAEMVVFYALGVHSENGPGITRHYASCSIASNEREAEAVLEPPEAPRHRRLVRAEPAPGACKRTSATHGKKHPNIIPIMILHLCRITRQNLLSHSHFCRSILAISEGATP